MHNTTTRCEVGNTGAGTWEARTGVAPCREVPTALRVKAGSVRVFGGRAGTYRATSEELNRVVGVSFDDCDDKTSEERYFLTAHGPAAMWRYWWSAPGEWSLVGDDEAVEHLVLTLDRLLGRTPSGEATGDLGSAQGYIDCVTGGAL